MLKARVPALIPRLQDEGGQSVGAVDRKAGVPGFELVYLLACAMSSAGVCSEGSDTIDNAIHAAQYLSEVVIFNLFRVEI
jgi:hypothetical protein